MQEFDMDMHVKNPTERPMLAVLMKKKTSKSVDRFFIVTKKGEHFLPTVFHGIGFWAECVPEFNPKISAARQFLDDQKYEEVWIPYHEIDHIKSLVYTKR
jgi:hypothetical protein